MTSTPADYQREPSMHGTDTRWQIGGLGRQVSTTVHGEEYVLSASTIMHWLTGKQ